MSKLFFKSFLPYRLTKTVEAFHDVDALNAALAVRPMRDPTSQEIRTAGFALAYVPREQTLADREDPSLVDELEPEAPLFVRSVNNGEFLLVAVTEVGNAYEAGTAGTIRQLEQTGLAMEKSWLTVGDDRVDDECAGNEAAGWIPATAAFPSGHDRPLAHPACRCTLLFRRAGGS